MSISSRNSTPQQKTFDPGAAIRPTELRAISSSMRNVTPVESSSESNQSSSTVQQTSVSNIEPEKLIIF